MYKHALYLIYQHIISSQPWFWWKMVQETHKMSLDKTEKKKKKSLPAILLLK